ncbi:D-alanyl-D-alanine carboxypeptidase [Streptomyces sp. BR123]|uniref:D-alanyl-D-alanine carboxypeptidase n=1 Tax=Streptomyces sp. BR123 TaxID=2749828 RepID=UPI00211AFB4A|nr:serine hydrolase [Streptomyces sp. BR123]
MKAMTVAGGSADDREHGRSTSAGAGLEDAPTDPVTADLAETGDAPAVALPTADDTAGTDADGALLTRGADAPGDEPESRAESDEPEPARDTARRKTAPGADHADAAPPPAPTPAAEGSEAASSGAQARSSADSHTDIAAEALRPTGGAQPAHGAAASGDSPVAQPDAEAGGKADRSPAVVGSAADNTARTRSDAKHNADTEQEPGRADTEAEPADTDADADADADAGTDTDTDTDTDADADADAGTDTDTDADADTKAGPRDDDTQVLTVPAPTAAEPESDTGADGTEAAVSPAPEASAPGNEPTSGIPSTSDAKSEEKSDSRLTLTRPARDKAKAGTEHPTRTDAPSADTKATADSDSRKESVRARGEESDSERTSKLVALVPLDVPAPAAPRPQPQPQASAPATPKAPLDLLAELTNTPAPPETPRRTALRRVKVWTPILLLLVGALVGTQLLRPLPAPRLVATETAHAVEGQFSVPWPAKGQGAVRVPGSGDIGTFGEQKPVPTASVAKVMTAYVILKGHPLRKNDPGPAITVDAKAVADGNAEDESRIQGLTAGTKFSQQDMLKMLMVPSANNAARLLARWDTGSDSEAAFVEKMNAAARELGMKDTTYTDPSGLDAGTVSTATDQLKLAEAVMKDEVFRTIVAMPSAPVKGLAEPLVNNNELLSVQGLSVRGIKTGSSTPAGGTLMWAAYKSVGDETPLILGTLMDQRVDGPDPNGTKSLALVLANSKKIIEAVRTALVSAPLVRKGDTVGHLDDGLGGRTPLVATKDLNVIGVPGQRLKISIAAGASPLPHKAEAGTEVGTLTAGDGEGAKSVPVAVRNALAEPSAGARLTRLG